MPIIQDLIEVFRDIDLFVELGANMKLRSYQREIAEAIVDSVRENLGLTFVILLPRQSGKNEIQAHIEAFLLNLYSRLRNYEIVKISPTWKPQSLNAMRRLERVLTKNMLTKSRWKKESGYIYAIDNTRMAFFSGAPTANIVGATASLLLECDEAQDVEIGKWDKDIAPMAASSNATRVFWGTAWTSKTLLARELRSARQAQEQDGIQRVFVRDGAQVGAEVPAYRKHLEAQVAKLGRQHPMVKTQYFSEEIEAEGGMFPAARRALMYGEHAPQAEPRAEGSRKATLQALYAFTIDVAGEDEGATQDIERLENPRRDATALTIFQVVIREQDPRRPLYLVVNRWAWTGIKHSSLFPRLRALAERWKPRFVVVDATGIGSGLATYFESFMPEGVLPFIFNSASKSKLGWDFIALIETGRYKEPAWDAHDPRLTAFKQQLEACQYEILEGPGKLMRWGVPEGSRDPANGEYVHDDLVISAALVTQLDTQVWGDSRSRVTSAYDPLNEMGW